MLSEQTLVNELLKVLDSTNIQFVGYPANAAESAANFTAAYDTYCQDAEDASGDSLAVTNRVGFESALAGGLASSTTAATAAKAFADAFLAYWTGATFTIGTPPGPSAPCPNIGGTGTMVTENTSVVTVVVPAPLEAALLAEFNILSEDAVGKASDLANAFHNATTSNVTVLISGVDGVATPVTNTCTVF